MSSTADYRFAIFSVNPEACAGLNRKDAAAGDGGADEEGVDSEHEAATSSLQLAATLSTA